MINEVCLEIGSMRNVLAIAVCLIAHSLFSHSLFAQTYKKLPPPGIEIDAAMRIGTW